VPFALCVSAGLYKCFANKNKRDREENNSPNQDTKIEKVVQNRETVEAQAIAIIKELLDRYAKSEQECAKSQQEVDKLRRKIDQLEGILEYVASYDKELILDLPETGDTDKINRFFYEGPYLIKKPPTVILNELGEYIRNTKEDFILKKDETDKLRLYEIFIASPDGLGTEREIIRKGIKCENDNHTIERGIIFRGRGWEDVPPGYDNAQSLINEELYRCKLCILVLWDQWGNPPYPDNETVASGSEAEYLKAVKLKESGQMEDIAVFFKTNIDSTRLDHPDEQLRKVLTFKEKIIEAKKPYFREFETPDELQRELSKLLANWARKLGKPLKKPEREERSIFANDDDKPDKI